VGTIRGLSDRLLGPGAGPFLRSVFVRVFDWEMLTASAAAKGVTVGIMLTVRVCFAATGQVFWAAGARITAANIAVGCPGNGGCARGPPSFGGHSWLR